MKFNYWNAFRHLMEALVRSMQECRLIGYDPREFARMFNQHGPVGSVQLLLSTNLPSSGFFRLWSLKRLDLTVEAIALDPEHAGLFGAPELEEARRRLRALGFIPPEST